MRKFRPAKLALIASVPLLLAATLSADTKVSPYTKLSLVGEGLGSQPTQHLTLGASVHNFSTDPSQAMAENARVMKKLRRDLKRLGVHESDYYTSDLTFQEGRDPKDRSRERADGYIVQHKLSIVLHDPKKAGEAMESLVRAGAKNLSMRNGRGYGRAIQPAVLKKARAAAVRDAQAKANDYARALGMKVRRVVNVTDRSAHATRRPMAAAMSVDAASTKVDAPRQTVVATVHIEFELEKAK